MAVSLLLYITLLKYVYTGWCLMLSHARRDRAAGAPEVHVFSRPVELLTDRMSPILYVHPIFRKSCSTRFWSALYLTTMSLTIREWHPSIRPSSSSFQFQSQNSCGWRSRRQMNKTTHSLSHSICYTAAWMVSEGIYFCSMNCSPKRYSPAASAPACQILKELTTNVFLSGLPGLESVFKCLTLCLSMPYTRWKHWRSRRGIWCGRSLFVRT